MKIDCAPYEVNAKGETFQFVRFFSRIFFAPIFLGVREKLFTLFFMCVPAMAATVGSTVYNSFFGSDNSCRRMKNYSRTMEMAMATWPQQTLTRHRPFASERILFFFCFQLCASTREPLATISLERVANTERNCVQFVFKLNLREKIKRWQNCVRNF